MLSLDLLAEQRIAEALERGEFDDLPGQGLPLDLSEDPLVPEDLRIAYRILKNAGYVPPEVDCLREIADLERFIDSAPDHEARRKAVLRLDVLMARVEAGTGARRTSMRQYRDRLLARLDRSSSK